MTTAAAGQAVARSRFRFPGHHALGWMAVGFAVVAFSLGSTLIKRADSPGVLLAFWRMVTTTIVWNSLLLLTGRRQSVANLKSAAVPGVLFGLSITSFFVGATHNSVANAELISALTPFVIVPIGARFFGEYINRRALGFAVLAFGGVAVVLFSAPAAGDASLNGNVFCALGMLLWTGYIATTRQFRGAMDVVEFMVSILPIAAITVLPVALATDGLGGLTWHGWKYVLLLTFVTGLGGHGLIVFAQRSIGIGTIGVAQVAQPALAAVWSFLLLGEELHGWQFVGMGLVLCGLLAFIVSNQRGNRRPLLPAEPTSMCETAVADTPGGDATRVGLPEGKPHRA